MKKYLSYVILCLIIMGLGIAYIKTSKELKICNAAFDLFEMDMQRMCAVEAGK